MAHKFKKIKIVALDPKILVDGKPYRGAKFCLMGMGAYRKSQEALSYEQHMQEDLDLALSVLPPLDSTEIVELAHRISADASLSFEESKKGVDYALTSVQGVAFLLVETIKSIKKQGPDQNLLAYRAGRLSMELELRIEWERRAVRGVFGAKKINERKRLQYESLVLEKAARFWADEPGRRIGDMAALVRASLSEEHPGENLPIENTIVNWIKAAGRTGRLAIPPGASAPGRPRNPPVE